MPFIWDYDINKLKKTKSGRRLILERLINYGVYPSSKEKISIQQVKKYWNELKIDPDRRRFLKFLIWGI
ncbi:hypothetical protein HYT74_03715 [Candidatus Daviesbacteria bacterium]|nr:hypothetical protein [Candidatus Daviesbacteria bacterium]